MQRFNSFFSHSILLGFLCLSITGNANDISQSDKYFLQNVAETGHYELEGSRLALKKAKDAEVVKFAKRMTEDHGNARASLRSLASSKGVELSKKPSPAQQNKLENLNEKEGTSFDKLFASTIAVSAHEQAVKLLEEAAEKAEDSDVKKFASDTLPIMKTHLEEAKRVNAVVNNEN